MKIKDTQINMGGLFRCCIDSWNSMDPETEVNEGDTFDCKHEEPGNKNLIFKDGVFQWNSEEKDKT